MSFNTLFITNHTIQTIDHISTPDDQIIHNMYNLIRTFPTFVKGFPKNLYN